LVWMGFALFTPKFIRKRCGVFLLKLRTERFELGVHR